MQEAGSIYSGYPWHARNIRPSILYVNLFNYLRSSPFLHRPDTHCFWTQFFTLEISSICQFPTKANKKGVWIIKACPSLLPRWVKSKFDHMPFSGLHEYNTQLNCYFETSGFDSWSSLNHFFSFFQGDSNFSLDGLLSSSKLTFSEFIT